MGAGVSGNQGKPSILAGAGRGRAFDAETDAAALRLLEDQKHLFADYTTVRQSLKMVRAYKAATATSWTRSWSSTRAST